MANAGVADAVPRGQGAAPSARNVAGKVPASKVGQAMVLARGGGTARPAAVVQSGSGSDAVRDAPQAPTMAGLKFQYIWKAPVPNPSG